MTDEKEVYWTPQQITLSPSFSEGAHTSVFSTWELNISFNKPALCSSVRCYVLLVVID